jgi:hypothetical protein
MGKTNDRAAQGGGTFDLKRGLYRRIYGRFLFGRRITRLPLAAEAWFWRLAMGEHVDDFGNLQGNPAVLHQLLMGLRADPAVSGETPTLAQTTAWTQQMVAVGLLSAYSEGGETYLHVHDWLVLQAAGVNGKRVRRYPAWAGEAAEAQRGAERAKQFANGSVGGCVLVNPGESKGEVGTNSYSYSQSADPLNPPQAGEVGSTRREGPDTRRDEPDPPRRDEPPRRRRRETVPERAARLARQSLAGGDAKSVAA